MDPRTLHIVSASFYHMYGQHIGERANVTVSSKVNHNLEQKGSQTHRMKSILVKEYHH